MMIKYSYFAPPKPRILGHRGAAGHAPENTLHSFETAARFTTYLETDAWITKDSVPVFVHDESLLRTCGVDVKVSELSFDELQTFDAGYSFTLDQGQTFPERGRGHRIPSVKSVLEKFQEKFFNIELKDARPESAKILVNTLRDSDALDRVLLAAEQDEVMQRLRAEKPESVPTSASYGEVLAFLNWLKSGAPSGGYRTAANAFQIPHRWESFDLATPEIIGCLHSLNIEVHYWTINDPVLIKKLVAAGADGIVTDRPELAGEFRP